MARAQVPPILSQIRAAKTNGEQAAALRALKNEVVGHVQKKETWVALGVLEEIVRILSRARTSAKLNGKHSGHYAGPRSLAEDDAVRLQAIQLLSSFASAGASFLDPLNAAGAVPAILSNICPFSNPPPVVLAALRTLLSIADASALATPSPSSDLQHLADSIFTLHHTDSLHSILTANAPHPSAQPQVALVTTLISRLCREESHQLALAESGVLDALATQLASFAVASGVVIPGADSYGRSDGLADHIPEPAPRGAKLAGTLEAISAVIGDSRFRAFMLLCSPPILAVFPTIKFRPSKTTTTAWDSLETVGMGTPAFRMLSAVDYLLPAMPVVQSRFQSRSQWLETREAKRTNNGHTATSGNDSARFEFGQSGDSDIDEAESPLIPWLIYLTRTRDNTERLMAASVLTSLFRAGFGSKSLRETSLGLLVVPGLLHLMCEHAEKQSRNDKTTINSATLTNWAILERAPAVLARLITDSEFLQKAAHDCGAVKILAGLLRSSYEPKAVPPPPKWSPHPDTGMEVEVSPPICRLGPEGQLPLLAHRIKLRESVLKAIAALASSKEEYKKAFVELNTVPYIVESLSQWPGDVLAAKERPKPFKSPDEAGPTEANTGYGRNPTSVIIAAAHTVRTLSRAVSILRTSLVDHSVHEPLFRYLRHPDTDVQVAATAVMCNLVMDCSPMRDALVEMGVVRVLCAHARSQNASLRLNALWCLKHFVISVSNYMKKLCLEELQPGWLVRLIEDDTEDEALHSTRASMTKQGPAGENGDMDDDIDMNHTEDEGKGLAYDEVDSRRASRARYAEARLNALRESELNPVRKARNDDLAIQEQGLGFIRNLIGPSVTGLGGEGVRETVEMIDVLFNELGRDRLFDILARKLRAKVLRPFTRRSAASDRDSRVLYPQPKIVEGVIYVLVHLSASIPRHRQIVVSQTELLKLVGTHFANKDKEVRVGLCHLINNLTCLEDSNDAAACAQRAHELAKLGYLTKLEAMKDGDVELDVRERAKTAWYQITKPGSS